MGWPPRSAHSTWCLECPLEVGQKETEGGAERWQGAKIRMLEESGVNLANVKEDADRLDRGVLRWQVS